MFRSKRVTAPDCFLCDYRIGPKPASVFLSSTAMPAEGSSLDAGASVAAFADEVLCAALCAV